MSTTSARFPTVLHALIEEHFNSPPKPSPDLPLVRELHRIESVLTILIPVLAERRNFKPWEISYLYDELGPEISAYNPETT